MVHDKIRRSDMIRCVLCHDAPCSRVCTQADPAALLRSIWFRNERNAAAHLPEIPCDMCAAPCEEACLRPHEVPIRSLLMQLRSEVLPDIDTALPETEDLLRTDICGVPLENPFLLSSSVVASTYEMCARAFDAGWAGAAFKTICSFEIHEASPRYSAVTGDNGSLIGFKNIEQLSDHSVEENMEVFRRLKHDYPTKVIVASIMGQNDAEWEELSALCEQNGADVIELNFSCPNMADGGLGSDIGQVPELVERFTAAARRGTRLPILAKLTPNVASMRPAAEAAIRGGADGIAAINTIKSITGVNLHTYVSAPSVRGMSAVGGYSGSAVKPIALRFVAEVAGDPVLREGKSADGAGQADSDGVGNASAGNSGVGIHISAMGGIENWTDALEFILLGAGSVQVTTAVMQYGVRIIDDLKTGLLLYMAEKGFHSIRDMVGLACDYVSETTDVLERDTILYPRFLADRCIGCGRCALSCRDGGHQAITQGPDRHPRLDPTRCVGCHLCILVCPEQAIRPSRHRVPARVNK